MPVANHPPCICPQVRMAAVEHVHRYSNSLDCARQIVQQEGALALLNGLGPTL